MKSLRVVFIFLIASVVSVNLQAQFVSSIAKETHVRPLKYYLQPPSYPWSSTDLYQIWERLDSICTPSATIYTHYPWRNTDLYQIWLKLDSCFGGSSGSIDTSNFWNIRGDSGTSASTNFLGTTDHVSLSFRTQDSLWMRLDTIGRLYLRSGIDSACFDCYTSVPYWSSSANIAIGKGVMAASTPFAPDSLKNYTNIFIGDSSGAKCVSCYGNVGIGDMALSNQVGAIHFNGSDYPPTFAFEMTAIGHYAFRRNISGNEGVAVGAGAGENNTTGTHNTFVGQGSFVGNTTGSDNIGLGRNSGVGISGHANTTGVRNVYLGTNAGSGENSQENCIIGYDAAKSMTTSHFNVAIGSQSFINNGGNNNAVIGWGTFTSQTSGANNSGLGYGTGFQNTTGSNNLFAGFMSGFYGTWNNTIIFDVLDRGTKAKINTSSPILAVANADSSLNTIALNGNTSTLSLIDIRKTINTTAGDAATMDCYAGRFRKDTTGTTFTLTNSLVTANSIILITLASDPGNATTHNFHVVAGSGSFVVTFENAPNNNTDVNFLIIN